MSKPKVSIIIPVHNLENYIRKSLSSVITQTLKDIEIICIDDGSTDDSLNILKEFAKKDSRIIIIEEETKGQACARNAGIAVAKGDYIGFVDGDDWVDSHMFEKMYENAKAFDSDITMCATKIFDEYRQSLSEDNKYYNLTVFDESFDNRAFSHSDAPELILDINVAVWNKIYKRCFLQKIKAKFEEGYIYEDLPFFYETYLKAEKISLVRDCLYFYRTNRFGSTMSNIKRKILDRIEMVVLTYNMFKTLSYYGEIKIKLVAWVIDDLFHRYTLVNQKYKKEFFFRMKKAFLDLDISDLDKKVLENVYYYNEFLGVKNEEYEDCNKRFFGVYNTFKKEKNELITQNKESMCNLRKICDGEIDYEKKKLEKESADRINIQNDWYEKELSLKIEQQKKWAKEEFNTQKKLYEERLVAQRLAYESDLKLLKEWFENELVYRENQQKEKQKLGIDVVLLQQKQVCENELILQKKNLQINFNEELTEQKTEIEAYFNNEIQKQKEWHENNLKEKLSAQAQWHEDQLSEQLKEYENNLKNHLFVQSQSYENNLKEKLSEQAQWHEDQLSEQSKEYENNLKENLSEQAQWHEDQLSEQSKEYENNLKEKLSEQAQWHEDQFFEQSQCFAEEIKNKLESQRNWFEAEIDRRIKEVDDWHNQKMDDINKQKADIQAEFESQQKQQQEKQEQYENEISKVKFALKVVKKFKNTEIKIKNIFVKPKMEQIAHRPKVSIVLPVYNVDKYLRQSLDSLLGQSLDNIEIICVNDGSTDKSADILEEYKAKDRRIKVLHKQNAGTGAARNDGLKMATGECIGFVDPDDWVKENMFERLYYLYKELNVDIVMCTPGGYDEQNQIETDFPYFVDENFPKELDNKVFSWKEISPFSYPMCVWNKLYKKELFDKNNIDFAEGLDFEDHKVIFKSLLTAEKIFFIREKLYIYRFNRVGSILSDNDSRLMDHIEIFDIVENILNETNTMNELRNDFIKYKIHNLLYYYGMIKEEHKQNYYSKMKESISETNLQDEEAQMLYNNYPELEKIIGEIRS